MKKLLFLLASLLCTVLCSCSPNDSFINTNNDVVISITENNTFSVLSKNPQTVKKGSDVYFRLSFIDGYDFDSASNGSYENNRLLVKNVLYSQTITINTVELLSVTLLNDGNSHFSVLSNNPVKIKKGQNAVFDVELDDGFKFEQSDNYVFEEGKLIFKNIQETCSVFANTIFGNMFKLTISNNNEFGTVTVTPSKTYYDEGEIVNITISPKNDNRFICLSEEKRIHELNNSSKPFSFKQSINLKIEKDYNLFVNYHDAQDYLMEYDLNGGTSFEGEDTIIFDYKLFGLRIRPNSLVNDSYIMRDGYFLESYNTKVDGSGVRIGIGSRIDTELFTDKYIKLYCQWIKETEASFFEYQLEDDGIVITNYLSNDKNVVVPREIDGERVISIKENTFDKKIVEKVYLPNSLKKVCENAFVDCGQLNELHYWTTLESISDKSFINCNNLNKIAINCSTYPKHLNSYARGNFADKLDHAQLLAKNGQAILAVGSSTLQYNHSFETMEETLDNAYNCYNLACLFAMPLQLMYDFALTMADDNDHVLIQLHETQASRTAPINTMVFAYLEGDLDRFLMINYQNHKKYMLSSWESYKKDTETMTNQMSYEYYDRGLKENGDYVWSSDESKITDDNKGSGVLTISSSYTYSNFEYLAHLHEYHNRKSTFLTFDTYNKNAIESMTSFYSFENLIKSNFETRFSIISNIDDSIIEGKYFRYEDNIHLNPTGGLNHCIFIANKIKNLIG